MLKIIYYIKTEKARQNGESPIIAKISYNGKSTNLSTGKYILKDRWKATNNLRNILKIEKEKVLKAGLDNLTLQLEKKFNELNKNGINTDLVLLKSHVKGRTSIKKTSPEKTLTLLDLFNRHNNEFKKKVTSEERSLASLQKYTRAKTLIEAFLRNKYAIDDIPFKDVNGAFIYNLESFLRYESEHNGKVGIKNNSVVKYFKNFKTVCNFAIRLELIESNPFTKFEGKINIKDSVYLTQNELDKIECKNFGIDRLDKVKDIFLFSCYTGYAPIDAENLTHDNLIQNNDGDYWIITDRIKTGVRANVPVLPSVLRIIRKYADNNQRLIPKISNQKMNSYLKEIADLCGIKKNLTWYVARHTFATTVTLGNGIRLENVSAMMGHTNIKQTQHYAKVLDSSINNDMKRLKRKYL